MSKLHSDNPLARTLLMSLSLLFQEMQCLQENFKELAPLCKSAVGNFTEDAAGDVGLDRILMKACTPMIKNFCGVRLTLDWTLLMD